MYIAMPEGGTRHPLAIRLIDDPVLRALVRAARPALNHVPAINHVHILERGDLDPVLMALVPDLQAVFAWLLEQDGDAAKVGMGPDPELACADLTMRRVADHLHWHDWPLGELIHQRWWSAQTLQQDRPQRSPQLAGFLVIPPDRAAEIIVGEVRPHVRTIDARELHNGILPTHEEALAKISECTAAKYAG